MEGLIWVHLSPENSVPDLYLNIAAHSMVLSKWVWFDL